MKKGKTLDIETRLSPSQKGHKSGVIPYVPGGVEADTPLPSLWIS